MKSPVMQHYVQLINLIGHGVSVRTKMFLYVGVNYNVMGDRLQDLIRMGYVKEYSVKASGLNPKAYALTDKGVKFYRVINEYWDVLGKNINSLQFL